MLHPTIPLDAGNECIPVLLNMLEVVWSARGDFLATVDVPRNHHIKATTVFIMVVGPQPPQTNARISLAAQLGGEKGACFHAASRALLFSVAGNAFATSATMTYGLIAAQRANTHAHARKHSANGTRTRVARVRAEYPNQLDYSGWWALVGLVVC